MNQTQMCLEAQRIMGKMCNMEISNSELDIKTSILATCQWQQKNGLSLNI